MNRLHRDEQGRITVVDDEAPEAPVTEPDEPADVDTVDED